MVQIRQDSSMYPAACGDVDTTGRARLLTVAPDTAPRVPADGPDWIGQVAAQLVMLHRVTYHDLVGACERVTGSDLVLASDTMKDLTTDIGAGEALARVVVCNYRALGFEPVRDDALGGVVLDADSTLWTLRAMAVAGHVRLTQAAGTYRGGTVIPAGALAALGWQRGTELTWTVSDGLLYAEPAVAKPSFSAT